jgi:hypothetical protein
MTAAMRRYCTPTRRTPRGAKRREDRVASSAGITITNLHGIGSTTARNDVLPSHEDGSDARDVGRATWRQQMASARHQPARAGFEFALEARIEQIRRRYRQQERVLEEEIARLEETYRFALAELDDASGHRWKGEEDDVCSVGEDGLDWETKSEYAPTEPRGQSRSPSPSFVVH